MEGDSPDEIVRRFVEQEPEEQVAGAREELARLLASVISDSDLRRVLLEDLGSYFDPQQVGLSVRDWLKHVHRLMS